MTGSYPPSKAKSSAKMTYDQSSGKHEILQKWKMKIFIVLVGKTKSAPLPERPCEQSTRYCKK
ncbi:hypothetical protein O5541_03485 [Escherichia coli]|nr:hypothetical protein [Escherichia coli]